MLQLHAQERRLYLVQSGVHTADLVMVLLSAAVVAQHTDFLCEHGIIGHDCPRIAERAEILRRVEAETAEIAKAPRHHPAEMCAVRLGAVLDHSKSMARSNLHHGRHLRCLPVEMDRHNGACACSDSSLDAGGIQIVICIRLDKDGRRSVLRDREHGCNVGVRRNDDLIPRADAERTQRERQRVLPRVQPDGIPCTRVGSELLLKGRQLRSENIPPRTQSTQGSLLIRRCTAFVLPAENSKVNLHDAPPPAPSAEMHHSRGCSPTRHRHRTRAP